MVDTMITIIVYRKNFKNVEKVEKLVESYANVRVSIQENSGWPDVPSNTSVVVGANGITFYTTENSPERVMNWLKSLLDKYKA